MIYQLCIHLNGLIAMVQGCFGKSKEAHEPSRVGSLFNSRMEGEDDINTTLLGCFFSRRELFFAKNPYTVMYILQYTIKH
jgi:hypothetical protein